MLTRPSSSVKHSVSASTESQKLSSKASTPLISSKISRISGSSSKSSVSSSIRLTSRSSSNTVSKISGSSFMTSSRNLAPQVNKELQAEEAEETNEIADEKAEDISETSALDDSYMKPKQAYQKYNDIDENPYKNQKKIIYKYENENSNFC